MGVSNGYENPESSGTKLLTRLLLKGLSLELPIGFMREEVVAAARVTANPSIEGMPKRLRLLCTPHVKR